MLQLLGTIIQWFIDGVTQIFNLITSIPKYIGVVVFYIEKMPMYVTVTLSLCVAALVIIKIKRLVL